MSDLKHAAAYLDFLRSSLDAKEGKPSPSEMPATNDSPPELTPETTPEMPPKTRLQPTSPATEGLMPARAIAALWARFSHLYGNRWVSVYGEALSADGILQPVAATWSRALANLTADDLARGLHACLDRAGPFLPDLPEFRALCLPPKLLAPYHKAFPAKPVLALPEPEEMTAARNEARKAKARTTLEGLKAMLRQGAATA